MYYKVKPGDTLSKISARLEVPLIRLIYANNLADPNSLSVGQQLLIPDEADNPFAIEIVLKDKILKLLRSNKVVKQYPVAIGKPSTPTPTGSWKIIHKYLWGEGFGGRFMQLSVPWGTYGIHGTNKPWSIGQNVSNGCVRMYSSDVAELYAIVLHGTPVLIY